MASRPTVVTSRPNPPETIARTRDFPARLTMMVKASTMRRKYSGIPRAKVNGASKGAKKVKPYECKRSGHKGGNCGYCQGMPCPSGLSQRITIKAGYDGGDLSGHIYQNRGG